LLLIGVESEAGYEGQQDERADDDSFFVHSLIYDIVSVRQR
jgi:hypothetical protein